MYSKDEAIKLKKDFWAAFANYTKFYSLKIGEPIQWILYKTGIKGVELKFEVESNTIQVILEINAKSPDYRFDLFVELDKYRKIIEMGFTNKINWTEEFELPEGKKVSRIFVEMHDLNYYKTENWPEIFRFMSENMYLLQTNFMEVQPILNEKYG